MNAASHAIEIADLRFSWTSGRDILAIPRFNLRRGERLLLRGPSGSGKSTLLALIAGLMPPDQGQLKVLGHDMTVLPPAARDRLRAGHLGVIFQTFNLLPYYSVLDNVLLPISLSPARRARLGNANPREEAERLLTRLGLGDLSPWRQAARALSIGQQQRVAAARALIGTPDLISADEPTSALDEQSRTAFLDLLFTEVERAGSALLFVSHDSGIASEFPRVAHLASLNHARVRAAA